LLAIVAVLRLRSVVVADARVHRNPIEHVAVRLKEREEPVIIFVTGGANRNAEDAVPGVDVVASRDDHPDVVLLEGKLHRLRHLELTTGRRRAQDAGARDPGRCRASSPTARPHPTARL
jgi:hypothetical protein